MQQLEGVLTQSIQQYERILEFMRKMDREVGTADSIALQDFSDSLNELQQEAMRLDQVLQARLDQKSTETEPLKSLFAKRLHILKEILLLNEKIVEKGSKVKSLIAHEMGKLRNGLSALSGYKQQQHHQGRIVNGIS